MQVHPYVRKIWWVIQSLRVCASVAEVVEGLDLFVGRG